ncbi:MAG: hypothetical protein LBI71_08400, partial [Enterobacteriaceae bacterium]|nr:hypothetical protein [Enterobacteriaceae bacterium]
MTTPSNRPAANKSGRKTMSVKKNLDELPSGHGFVQQGTGQQTDKIVEQAACQLKEKVTDLAEGALTKAAGEKTMAKVQKAQSLVQQGQKAAGLLGGSQQGMIDGMFKKGVGNNGIIKEPSATGLPGGRNDIMDDVVMRSVGKKGIIKGPQSAGLPGGMGSALPGGGFTGGLAQKAAAGHSGALQALEKVSRLPGGG